MSPEALEIQHDEMRDDTERASEYEKLASRRCVDCKHAHWLDGRVTIAFKAAVDYLSCLGVCVINDDLPPIGITDYDSAESVACDYFEAMER